VEGCSVLRFIPDQLVALVLKWADHLVESRDEDRHLQDAAGLVVIS